jgi:LysM repeat protein
VNNLKKDLFHTYPRLAQNQEYIVQKGDTLYQISEKFGVSVAEIMEKNQIFDTLIYPNQIIVIPRKAENTVYFEEYITKENDSIASISKNLIANMELLIKYNDLTKLILNENQVLRIPRQKS